MREHSNTILTDKKFSDLNPLVVGFEKCKPDYAFGPWVRNNYLIHYIVSGEGVLYKNDKEYPVKKGEFFLIEPGEVTTYKADSELPWHYIWVEFNGELSKRFSTLSSPVVTYNFSTFTDMLHVEEFNNMREEFVVSKLFELYSHVFENSDKLSDYEKRIYNYIKLNYMRDISVDELSSMIGLNRRYMSRMFKQKTGYTVKEYITKTRMEHAFTLLQLGYSVFQVSVMVGYSDAFNFSKMFKKYYGMTPTSIKTLKKN